MWILLEIWEIHLEIPFGWPFQEIYIDQELVTILSHRCRRRLRELQSSCKVQWGSHLSTFFWGVSLEDLCFDCWNFMWLLFECVDIFQSKHMGFGDMWGAGQSTHHMDSAKKCFFMPSKMSPILCSLCAQVAARLDRNRQVVYLTGTADALKAARQAIESLSGAWRDANQRNQRRIHRLLGLVKVDWGKRSSEHGSIDQPSPSDLLCSFNIIDCRDCHFPLLLGYRGSTEFLIRL